MSDTESGNAAAESATEPHLNGVTFVSVYVDDFDRAYEFYTNVLGLEKQYDMGDLACFLRLNDDVGLYLQGGNKPTPPDDANGRHASFGLTASSVSSFWERVRAAGAPTVQTEPMDMGGGWYWFQCHDPAGNLIEIVGEM